MSVASRLAACFRPQTILLFWHVSVQLMLHAHVMHTNEYMTTVHISAMKLRGAAATLVRAVRQAGGQMGK